MTSPVAAINEACWCDSSRRCENVSDEKTGDRLRHQLRNLLRVVHTVSVPGRVRGRVRVLRRNLQKKTFPDISSMDHPSYRAYLVYHTTCSRMLCVCRFLDTWSSHTIKRRSCRTKNYTSAGGSCQKLRRQADICPSCHIQICR
jgi:hypothetical protein